MFPKELMSGSVEERIEYFSNRSVAHPRLMNVDKQLQNAIRNPGDQLLIFVYGPTGVGKTTLVRRVENVLISEGMKMLEQNPGHIPVVSVEVTQDGTHQFSWKSHYERILSVLQEPISTYRGRPSASDFRRVLENALCQRQPQACILDEAQHLWNNNSGQSLQRQLDTIKSLANISGVPHVLVGTYEMLAFRNRSGQLSRRSHDIHFQRYDANNADDVAVFRHVIDFFQSRMPFATKPNLVEHWQFLYEQTMGCIGVLKLLMNKAYKDAVEADDETMTLGHLEEHAYTVSQRTSMLEAITYGEGQLVDDPIRSEAIRKSLGLDQWQAVTVGGSLSQQSARRKTKPGVRRPHRDSVGIGEMVE